MEDKTKSKFSNQDKIELIKLICLVAHAISDEQASKCTLIAAMGAIGAFHDAVERSNIPESDYEEIVSLKSLDHFMGALKHKWFKLIETPND